MNWIAEPLVSSLLLEIDDVKKMNSWSASVDCGWRLKQAEADRDTGWLVDCPIHYFAIPDPRFSSAELARLIERPRRPAAILW